MANVRFFFRVLHFKIALAKTTMMCNLATEPFENKIKKKNKTEQGDFGPMILPMKLQQT